MNETEISGLFWPFVPNFFLPRQLGFSTVTFCSLRPAASARLQKAVNHALATSRLEFHGEFVAIRLDN